MTEDQVVQLLKEETVGRTQVDLAKEIGISPQYLHDVLNGRRSPGEAILKYLQIEKRETYIRIKLGADATS
jgi:transcriptional regulator with XRE-family HTH domain